jgi:hypothetical protein
MRLELFFLVFLLVNSICYTGKTQHFFPVKLDKKWGLINTDGKLVQDPIYDAIGEFKHFGYAVMQKNGAVGLLGPNGKERLEARYDDIKVLSKNLIAVMQDNEWRVINPDGQTVLDKGYARVHILKPGYLVFQVKGKWGLVKADGTILAEPRYDKIETKDDSYFQTRIGDKIGLLSATGQELLSCIAAEIRPTEQGLIFYRQSRLWGAIDQLGITRLSMEYESFRALGASFFKLFANNKTYLYSQACGALLKQTDYSDFYVFSNEYLAAEKNQRLGLVNACGQQVIPSLYQEIQPYGDTLFRVSFEGSWGVVNTNNKAVIPLAYQYISPMQGPVCVVKQADAFGIMNIHGEVVVPPAYQRIELEEGQARAYQHGQDGQEELVIFTFDENGLLVQNSQFNQHFQIRVGGKEDTTKLADGKASANFQLKKYEWFYDPAIDRWGLRSIIDGKIQIEPTFDFIQVEKELGYTIVGIWKSNDYEFERTSFRYDMIFGLVLNELGILVTEVAFLDVRMDDFQQGLPTARVVFSNGRHGLIDRIGRIIRQDITYIGNFQDGLARVSFSGKLSGARETDYSLGALSTYLNSLLSPNYMLDYTQYDQLFQQNASLICQNCEWGYLDTLGQVVVKPNYTFVLDLVNQSGLVNCSGKWGMINQSGNELIPCKYDQIAFLENTDNRMVRVYLEQPKYGLIDTLGQLTVSAVYEEIGSFSDGRLAVKRNGLWGFVDRNGLEVIPCRFDEVQNFSEGKAAARLQKNWGFIDIDGDTVIPFQYIEVGNFNQEMAWVKTPSGVGYINEAEQFLISPSFDQAFDFYRGVARVVVDQQYGLINTSGQFLLKPRYGEIEAFDEQGLAIFKFGRDQARYGLLKLSGQVITQSEFRSINPFREGRALVKTKQGYGFIDINGRLVIEGKYAKASDFHEGRAMVQLNSKCGYIGLNGEEIVPCSYSRCQDFSGGRAVVYQGIKNAGIIDLDGKLIVEPSLDRLLEFQEGRGLMRDDNYRFYYITEETSLYDGYYDRATAFRHGVAVVQINGKWGIINQKGIEIIPPKYDHIDSFENGYAKVKIEGYNGLSNLNGELIVQPHYEFISYAGDGLFRVEQGDKIGYFDSRGSWVWELNK